MPHVVVDIDTDVPPERMMEAATDFTERRPEFRAAGAPRVEWLFIGLAAFFFLLGHPAAFGTIAFGSLFIAALLHERRASCVRAQALPNWSRPALTE